jgi:hypothetical protein
MAEASFFGGRLITRNVTLVRQSAVVAVEALGPRDLACLNPESADISHCLKKRRMPTVAAAVYVNEVPPAFVEPSPSSTTWDQHT